MRYLSLIKVKMLYKIIPSRPPRGRIAKINTSTPIPPIQCEKLRQNSIHFGRLSTSGRILAPVVVKPDTISNIASTGLGITPLNTNGSAPMILNTIQLNETDTKPSFAKKERFPLFLWVICVPTTRQAAPHTAKYMPLDSP